MKNVSNNNNNNNKIIKINTIAIFFAINAMIMNAEKRKQ